MFKVGLIGVPIETVPIQECWTIKSAYIPELTDSIRQLIIENVNSKHIKITDLGELEPGVSYNCKYRIDRLGGIPFLLEDVIQTRDLEKLEQERLRLLLEQKNFDLLLAVGPSHLGGMVLYDENDVVVRMDHHADYNSDIMYKQVWPTYASYMNWVEHNIKNVDVINYFVHFKQSGDVFGREDTLKGTSHLNANHFDIDIDCFDPSYRIQDIYNHETPSGISPNQVLKMIEEARPSKIGVWEYRPSRDYDNNGLQFIVDTVELLASKD